MIIHCDVIEENAEPIPLVFDVIDSGRAWLQAGAQQAVLAVVPSFNSLGIDSRNETTFPLAMSSPNNIYNLTGYNNQLPGV